MYSWNRAFMIDFRTCLTKRSSRSSSILLSPPIVFRPVCRGSSSDEFPPGGRINEVLVFLLMNDVRPGGFTFGLLKGLKNYFSRINYPVFPLQPAYDLWPFWDNLSVIVKDIFLFWLVSVATHTLVNETRIWNWRCGIRIYSFLFYVQCHQKMCFQNRKCPILKKSTKL